ncbi:MAG: sigma-70 family RNA polymerase sigma factor [Acidobacteriota bacterium]|nr:sigma-70 family RNA polymerase sigma factor [Acidobacteriota bacterium]
MSAVAGIDSGSDRGVGCSAGPFSAMNPRELFESNLSTIDRIVATVCRRARIRGADAEDFASTVRVGLLENDCAILRKYEGRSSLPAYLTVVISRMLSDERIQSRGRWYASNEAERLGPAAVLLETLLRRDRRSMEEALPIVSSAYPEITRAEAERIADRLPLRSPRPRFVELDDAELPPIAAAETADESIIMAEQQRLSQRTARVVRETLASFSLEDRTLVRLHFGSSMSIADVSRMMRLPQRPLYRRLERSLAAFRSALLEAGVDAGSVRELISSAVNEEMDFGLPPPIPFRLREEA